MLSTLPGSLNGKQAPKGRSQLNCRHFLYYASAGRKTGEPREGSATNARIRIRANDSPMRFADPFVGEHMKEAYVARTLVIWAAFLCSTLLCGIKVFAQTTDSNSVINLATPIPGVVTVNLPKDIPLVVETAESINSYSAATGERVKYRVLQDFVVAGYLIAKAGDEAEGMVQEGQQGKAGFYGIGYKAANLRVSVDKIYTFCGSTLQVDFDRSEYRRRQGFMGSNKDVGIVKGQQYVPIVDHPQQVCAVRTDEKALPIPKDALHADKG